ncbi:MAG: LamG domain-containing protein, partial [bacterium]|nr:LamG domain-containing protein [bacterium]
SDTSGNNNNGTLVNMDTNTCWVNGRLGKALAFDGVNDYVNCGNNSSLNITDAITIETWIKFDSFADWAKPLDNNLYRIFHRGWGHSLYFLYHIAECARPGDSSWDYWAGVGSLTGLQAGQWYHVACVKSGNTMSIYINGVKERELDCLTGYTIDNTQMTNLYMGMGYNYFNGELDEVRIYPVALSAEKIYKNYRLAGQWHLNEGQGSVAKDTSGNSSDGTLVNMNTGTCWVNGKQGKALAFDGLDDYVNCGSGANLNVTDKLTVEAWIKPDTGNDNHAIARKGEYTYSFATDNGKLKLSIGSSSGSGWNTEVEGETTLDSSQWYHVVGTYDKTTGIAEVYINGKWDGNSSAKKREAIKSELSSWLSMGAGYAGSDYFYGTLDGIKVYKGLLSQGEIYSNWLKYK